MPTQEMPDNEMDDLFRKAAEEYTPGFEPEAWRRMEKLLDEQDGRTGSYWWKGILLTLALLLTGTLGGWLLLNSDAPAKTPVAGNPAAEATAAPAHDAPANDAAPAENGNAEAKKARVNPPADGASTGAGERDERTGEEADKARNGRSTALSTGRSTTPGTTRSTTRAAKPPETAPGTDARKYRAAGPAPRGKTTFRPRRNGNTGSNDETGGERNETKGLRPAPGLADNRPDRAVGNDPSVPDNRHTAAPAPQRLPELALLAGRTIPVEPPVLRRTAVPPPAAAPGPEIEPAAGGRGPRLGVGIMVSPDLSSIGFFNRFTPGTNAGVQLEYRLGNRFRVGVGAIYSVKLYSARVEDYTVPKGFWTYGVKPSGIDAHCKILDLPVHLRFDAVQRQRYNFFISTGLSSYIMLSERYNYTYPAANPYLRPSWSGRRTGEYYFSVVNVSTGYERNLAGNFSWQVEPFLKLPLGGVGFGKVKLISSGVFLSVKYRIKTR